MRNISPCVVRIKSSQSYPTNPNKTHTVDLWRFVGEKTLPDIVSGGELILSQIFRKRFWVVTPFYGFFKKFDIDIVEG